MTESVVSPSTVWYPRDSGGFITKDSGAREEPNPGGAVRDVRTGKGRFDPVIYAYAAGILDGEGCIHLGRDHSRRTGRVKYNLRVQVSMTDSGPVSFLHTHFQGMFRTYTGSKATYRPIYIWATSTRQAAAFLRLVLPFLRAKTSQAELAIEYAEAVQAAQHPGRKGYSQNFRDYQVSVYERLRELKRL